MRNVSNAFSSAAGRLSRAGVSGSAAVTLCKNVAPGSAMGCCSRNQFSSSDVLSNRAQLRILARSNPDTRMRCGAAFAQLVSASASGLSSPAVADWRLRCIRSSGSICNMLTASSIGVVWSSKSSVFGCNRPKNGVVKNSHFGVAGFDGKKSFGLLRMPIWLPFGRNCSVVAAALRTFSCRIQCGALASTISVRDSPIDCPGNLSISEISAL